MTAAERDALRGVMWEAKWRGTLEEWGRSQEEPEVKRRADALLDTARTPVPPVPAMSDWPGGRVGWGTYRYGGDPVLVRAAVRQSCPLIDTAEGYGYGRVEKCLGAALREGRGGTWVATKVARNHSSHWAVLKAGLRSRDHLGHPIDLYQVHWPPPTGSWEEVMDGMASLREREVIRYVGVSNCCVGQLVAARTAARARGFDVVSNQMRLHLQDRGALEYLIPYCAGAGVRIIVHSPLGQGRLGVAPLAALAWVLSQPGVTLVIPGTNNLEHLLQNLREGKGAGGE